MLNANNKLNKPKSGRKAKSKSVMVSERPQFEAPNSISLLPHIQLPLKKPRGERDLKIYDIGLLTLAPTTTAGLNVLYAPSQGSSLNQRVGDIVYMKKFEILYTCNAANADIFSSLRVLVFQWKPNNNLIAPAVTDIFQTTSDGIYSLIDVNYGDQFHIIYDQLHNFSGTAINPSASANQSVHKIYKENSFGNPKVTFASGSTSGSNILYLLSVSDSAIAPAPNLIFKTRIAYEEE